MEVGWTLCSPLDPKALPLPPPPCLFSEELMTNQSFVTARPSDKVKIQLAKNLLELCNL
jgi:hypothetical protein